jgi:hypothetical protein
VGGGVKEKYTPGDPNQLNVLKMQQNLIFITTSIPKEQFI